MNLANQMVRSAWQDRLLTQLELAMDGSLLPCLPPDLTTRAAQRRAIRTAANPGADAKALSLCRNRLYAALTYLEYECNAEDCTYASVAKLLTVDPDTLRNMLGMARHTPRRLQRHYGWVLGTPQEIDGDVAAMVRLRCTQEAALPGEETCIRAVSAALAVLRGTASI